MNATMSLRQQLTKLLTWSDAHINFDDAVAGLPVAARGKVPKGLPVPCVAARRAHATRTSRYSGVQREPTIQEKQWPSDYWPASPVPPTRRAWSASIARFKKDRRALQRLVANPRRDLLARTPTGSGQTILREFVLAADHNAYHVGQLVAVRRLLGHWPGA